MPIFIIGLNSSFIYDTLAEHGPIRGRKYTGVFSTCLLNTKLSTQQESPVLDELNSKSNKFFLKVFRYNLNLGGFQYFELELETTTKKNTIFFERHLNISSSEYITKTD